MEQFEIGSLPHCGEIPPKMYAWTIREENYGGFAQFAVAKEKQCLMKPKTMDWIEAASVFATGVTVYRMLTHWKENRIKPGDAVLVWGGTDRQLNESEEKSRMQAIDFNVRSAGNPCASLILKMIMVI